MHREVSSRLQLPLPQSSNEACLQARGSLGNIFSMETETDVRSGLVQVSSVTRKGASNTRRGCVTEQLCVLNQRYEYLMLRT